MLGTHTCIAELGRDLIRLRQAEGIAEKRNHGGNVGGRPRVADVKAAAVSKVEACQRGFARWVATVSEITLDGEEFTESEETVNTVDPLDRVPELRTLAREAAARRADGKIIRDIAGHTEPVGSARCGGDIYSLYRVEGSAFGDFTCYRVGRAPYNGTLYLPAGFHDYGIATLRGLFAALEGGQCEFLREYQDEIDGVYHGLFEKRI